MSNLSSYTDDQLFDLYASNIGEELRSRGYEHGWYKRTVYVGEIYVLVNRAFPKLVKIGYSVDAKQRARQLSSNTAVPSPFHVYCIYRVKKDLADKRLHDLIDTLNPDLHYAQNREFFKMSPEDAYGMLKAIAEMVGDEEQLVLNPYSDEYVDELLHLTSETEFINHVNETTKLVRHSQPPFDFHEFGIMNGEVLVFWDAKKKVSVPSITAVVSGRRKIICDGVETSLSAKAGDVMGLKHSPRGTEWWTWHGRRLVDIYTEKYPKPKSEPKSGN